MSGRKHPPVGGQPGFEDQPAYGYDVGSARMMGEDEFEDLRARILTGVGQARRGELADGTGEEAIRRAFAAARR